jgi:hypothetical protein
MPFGGADIGTTDDLGTEGGEGGGEEGGRGMGMGMGMGMGGGGRGETRSSGVGMRDGLRRIEGDLGVSTDRLEV